MSLVVLVFVLGVVYLARHPLLRAAGGFWIVDEAPQPSDAIVILGDDNYSADRAARAAELYRARWAPRVVASGRFLRPYASIADLMQRDLVERGVPAGAVVRFTHHANDTREELGGLNQLISERRWHHILVVTSNYHTRRARYILERTFPSGVELRVVAAPDSEYDPASWWTSRLGTKLFFHEFVGMAVVMWELRHSSAGAGAVMISPTNVNRAGVRSPADDVRFTTWPRAAVYSSLALYYSSATAVVGLRPCSTGQELSVRRVPCGGSSLSPKYRLPATPPHPCNQSTRLHLLPALTGL